MQVAVKLETKLQEIVRALLASDYDALEHSAEIVRETLGQGHHVRCHLRPNGTAGNDAVSSAGAGAKTGCASRPEHSWAAPA
jgi:hypothetical protein